MSNELENHFTIFGASAIEDLLQENLEETIDILKIAGIKVWVITGDKAKTAENIALSAKLFDKDKEIEVMDEVKL